MASGYRNSVPANGVNFNWTMLSQPEKGAPYNWIKINYSILEKKQNLILIFP